MKHKKLKRTHNAEQSVKIFLKGLNVSLSAHFLSAHSHMPQNSNRHRNQTVTET
jgi:hypothetical protein